MAGDAIFDPCFAVAGANEVLCGADPRKAASGTRLTLAAPLPSIGGASAGTSVWFFELPDGSTCQPLTGTRREIEGQMEVYACRFAAVGDDAVILGEIDRSAPVWTVQKVQLNKKMIPPSIKSLDIVSIAAAWQ
jgi:hypothetical protein